MTNKLRILGWICAASGITSCNEGIRTNPSDRLAQAASAMGTIADLSAVGPLTVHAAGTLDKAAEGQGHLPNSPSPAPYLETIAIDPGGTAVRWEYREARFDGTRENFGETYPSDSVQFLLIRDIGISVPFTSESFSQERARLRRRLPHVVVDEMLSNSNLSYVDADTGSHRIRGTIADTVSATVTLDDNLLVQDIAVEVVLPGRGPVSIQWWFDDYRIVSGPVRLPYRYGSRVGGLDYTNMAVDSVITSLDLDFLPPNTLHTLEPRERVTGNETPPDLALRELAQGIFSLPNVRGGFAPLVVEFDTFLVVTDAPASFPLLGQLPPSETDPGPSMSWASERMVNALQQEWPTKRIAYTVLTHHHEDHVGGIRAFIAAGATIMGARSTEEVVRRLAALPATAVNDRLGDSDEALRFEVVDGPLLISDGTQEIEVIPMGDNPHADGMLVLRFPRVNTFYVSDFVTPGPLDDYPGSNHAALDRFFAAWLNETNHAPDSIWSMHGGQTLTRDHLAVLEASPTTFPSSPQDSSISSPR